MVGYFGPLGYGFSILTTSKQECHDNMGYARPIFGDPKLKGAAFSPGCRDCFGPAASEDRSLEPAVSGLRAFYSNQGILIGDRWERAS